MAHTIIHAENAVPEVFLENSDFSGPRYDFPLDMNEVYVNL